MMAPYTERQINGTDTIRKPSAIRSVIRPKNMGRPSRESNSGHPALTAPAQTRFLAGRPADPVLAGPRYRADQLSRYDDADRPGIGAANRHRSRLRQGGAASFDRAGAASPGAAGNRSRSALPRAYGSHGPWYSQPAERQYAGDRAIRERRSGQALPQSA